MAKPRMSVQISTVTDDYRMNLSISLFHHLECPLKYQLCGRHNEMSTSWISVAPSSFADADYVSLCHSSWASGRGSTAADVVSIPSPFFPPPEGHFHLVCFPGPFDRPPPHSDQGAAVLSSWWVGAGSLKDLKPYPLCADNSLPQSDGSRPRSVRRGNLHLPSSRY